MKQVAIASIFVQAAGGIAGARFKYRTNTMEVTEVRTGEDQTAAGDVNDELGSWAGEEERSYAIKHH